MFDPQEERSWKQPEKKWWIAFGLFPLWIPEVTAQLEGLILAIVVLVIFALMAILGAMIRIIQPYQQGLYIRLGNFMRVLNPGVNFVAPLVSQVVKIDLRTQVLDVPRQEVITKDNSPTNVDAIIYIKVIDPIKSFFEVTDYTIATIALAQTTLRSILGDMELDEILYNRDTINVRLRDVLDHATDAWGVKVEAVEIREVDPVGPVKAAMEEQTAAERQRRAAILRADGEKRSAILVAEGSKRSRILEAEGLRQAKVLEAEGQRLAIILEGQGNAQKLRILALGAAPLDSKALTVLSLDTVKEMANGQATKIVFPFEISRLMESASEYMGASRKIPEREIAQYEDLEKLLGQADDILGPIPKHEELRAELKTIEDQLIEETKEAEEIAHISEKGKTAKKILREKEE
ncbi:MAG: SPFH/Band 7/PHB domain protein [Thermoplasmata archaeon]|nr:SPFH/Band 7/PHB domain protein [Thermoplasmata archaeon]